MSPEILAPDVAWEPSGHLSEVALSVAADGEYTLLDTAMHEHLASCEACAAHLGVVALRSADVAEVFAVAPGRAAKQQAEVAAREQPAIASAQRPRVPLLAIAAALVIAVVGALPSIFTVPEQVAHGWSLLQKVAPSMLRLTLLAVHRAWSGGGAPWVATMWALAAALVAMGLAIAKRASKKMLLDGGRR